ncbi:MAG: hypothetical protein DHS20C01_00090 [marine bacterium B5-7]|nr:MAG: hypothetical protein DHS20C01_00090 [marine bacterium B5-7]
MFGLGLDQKLEIECVILSITSALEYSLTMLVALKHYGYDDCRTSNVTTLD